MIESISKDIINGKTIDISIKTVGSKIIGFITSDTNVHHYEITDVGHEEVLQYHLEDIVDAAKENVEWVDLSPKIIDDLPF